MKHEWRKHEKERYLPNTQARLIDVPTLKYYTLKGKGNPNTEAFSIAIGALYAMSYGIKMAPKKGLTPDGYFDYTVYPLEGLWTLNEAGKADVNRGNSFELEDLEYEIMIRQPDFVTPEFALATIARVSENKPNPHNEEIKFKEITEGLAVQLMHHGLYKHEDESFAKLAQFCQDNHLERTQRSHREIYISDPRRTAPEKNRTVLRHTVRALD